MFDKFMNSFVVEMAAVAGAGSLMLSMMVGAMVGAVYFWDWVFGASLVSCP